VHRWFGVPIQVALLMWKPIGVLLMFFGFRAYIRRLVPSGWPARIALFLGLFAVTPWSALAGRIGADSQTRYTLDFISGEMWTSQTLFGDPFTAVALGLMPIVLIGVSRFRNNGNPALLALLCGGAAIVTWLQPWQGAELLMTILGVELWRKLRHGVPLNLLLAPVLAIGTAPAAYYAWMGATDSSWKHYAEVNRAGAQALWSWPLWAVAISLAPLLIPALLAYRGGAPSWQSCAVRIWPVTVAIAYLQPTGSFPYHAVQGLALPLSILAVEAFTTRKPSWLPRPRWWWVIPAVLAMSVPGTVHKVRLIRDSVRTSAFPYVIADGEQQALDWLSSEPPGGVLTDFYGGVLVPGFSGQESYIGQFSLTPNFDARVRRTGELMSGALTPAEAQRFVLSTGARYVLQTCRGKDGKPAQPPLELGAIVLRQLDFGCARVYVIGK
jgi:hypothetical protein